MYDFEDEKPSGAAAPAPQHGPPHRALLFLEAPRFAGELAALHQMAPELILSSHLPPARRLIEPMLGTLARLPDAPHFVGPDQAAMEEMMAELTAVPSD